MKMPTNVIESANHRQQDASHEHRQRFETDQSGNIQGSQEENSLISGLCKCSGKKLPPNHGKGQVDAIFCTMNRRKCSKMMAL